MAKTDIMIDLETLATSPDAAILTIGAVKFDPFGDDINEPNCDKFYVKVDLDSCDRIGLVTHDDTIAWWANQSKEAQEEAFSPDNRIDIGVVPSVAVVQDVGEDIIALEVNLTVFTCTTGLNELPVVSSHLSNLSVDAIIILYLSLCNLPNNSC